MQAEDKEASSASYISHILNLSLRFSASEESELMPPPAPLAPPQSPDCQPDDNSNATTADPLVPCQSTTSAEKEPQSQVGKSLMSSNCGIWVRDLSPQK